MQRICNLKKFFSYIFLVYINLLVLSGCSQKKVSTYFINPPNNPEVSKYKTIAFLPFKGKNGDLFSLELESKVKNLSINGKPIFKVIDRQNLKTILSEQKLSLSGLVDESKAIKIGKLLGVSGIWTGAVLKNNVSIYPFYERRFKCLDEKCKKTKEYLVRCYRKEANFSFIARLLDVSTGEVVYSKNNKGFASGEYCLDSGYTVSSQYLLNLAKERAIKKFLKDIAPYKTYYSLKIKEDIEGISEKDEETFKNSLDWIDAKDLNKACDIWKKLLKKYPNNITLLYNLGVCYETKNNLTKAYTFYKKAYNLLSKPDEDVINALNRIKKLLKRQNVLQKSFLR